ncbi:hypothetical protein AUL54_04420 [Bacillus sp. SDLI1]|nr:hypothetical protein AUL54_04420 [Bacillus sp. SDLI1]
MYTRNDPAINFTGFLETFNTPLNPSFKIIPKNVTSVTPKASIEIKKNNLLHVKLSSIYILFFQICRLVWEKDKTIATGHFHYQK